MEHHKDKESTFMKYVAAARKYSVKEDGELDAFPENFLSEVPTSEEDKAIFKCFLDYAMPAVSKSTFKRQIYFDTLSEVVSVGEETFAFLVVENNIERWIFMAEKLIAEKDENHAPPVGEVPAVRYQKGVKQRKDAVYTAGEWTSEGMQRFNDIVSKVHYSRNERSDFENELKSKYGADIDDSLLPKMLLKRKAEEDKQNEQRKPRKVTPVDLFDWNGFSS